MEIKENTLKNPGNYFHLCTGFLGCLFCFLALVVPEIIKNLNTFMSNADIYLQETQAFIYNITGFLGIHNVDISSITTLLEDYLLTLDNSLNDMLPQIIEVTTSFVSTVATGVIAFVLSVYIMSGKDNLLPQLKKLCLPICPPLPTNL